MTSAQDGLAAIEHLDWHTIQCQMDGGCPNDATHMVEIHVVDYCDESWTGPFGNSVGFLCDWCVAEVDIVVADQVKRFNLFGRKMCLTCGAPVVDVKDILRERKKL
jgi:hypothetical protein